MYNFENQTKNKKRRPNNFFQVSNAELSDFRQSNILQMEQGIAKSL